MKITGKPKSTLFYHKDTPLSHLLASLLIITLLMLDVDTINYMKKIDFPFFLCIDVLQPFTHHPSVHGLKNCQLYSEIQLLKGNSGMLRGCAGTHGQGRTEPGHELLPIASSKGSPRLHVKVG